MSAKRAIAPLLVGAMAAAVASAEIGDWIHVPSTISPEAREALRSLDPSFLEMKLPAADDSEGWSQIQ